MYWLCLFIDNSLNVIYGVLLKEWKDEQIRVTTVDHDASNCEINKRKEKSCKHSWKICGRYIHCRTSSASKGANVTLSSEFRVVFLRLICRNVIGERNIKKHGDWYRKLWLTFGGPRKYIYTCSRLWNIESEKKPKQGQFSTGGFRLILPSNSHPILNDRLSDIR